MILPTCSLLMPLTIVTDRNDFHAGAVQVVDGFELYVEQVADGAMRVGGVADAVELQIGVAHSGFGCLLRRTRDSSRIRFRWLRPARCCIRLCGRSERRRGSTATEWARRLRTAPTSGDAA